MPGIGQPPLQERVVIDSQNRRESEYVPVSPLNHAWPLPPPRPLTQHRQRPVDTGPTFIETSTKYARPGSSDACSARAKQESGRG
jgi:hypothetical protein